MCRVGYSSFAVILIDFVFIKDEKILMKNSDGDSDNED